MANITGTSGADTITPAFVSVAGQPFPSAAADSIAGLAGDDVLDGGHGHDTLLGGGDADRLNGGPGDDVLIGGDHCDTLDGGGGNDWASYETAGFGLVVSLANPAANDGEAKIDSYAGIENLRGAGVGEAGKDTLIGQLGDDTVEGGATGDVLTGGAGQDAFRFSMPPVAGQADSITDLAAADRIEIVLAASIPAAATGWLPGSSAVRRGASRPTSQAWRLPPQPASPMRRMRGGCGSTPTGTSRAHRASCWRPWKARRR